MRGMLRLLLISSGLSVGLVLVTTFGSVFNGVLGLSGAAGVLGGDFSVGMGWDIPLLVAALLAIPTVASTITRDTVRFGEELLLVAISALIGVCLALLINSGVGVFQPATGEYLIRPAAVSRSVLGALLFKSLVAGVAAAVLALPIAIARRLSEISRKR